MKNDPEEKEWFRGQFFRPVPSPELDNIVLGCARQMQKKRRLLKRLRFSLLPAAAALTIGFGVIFAGHPATTPVPLPPHSELSGLWDWSKLENEGAELTASIEYAGAALASL